VDPLNQVYSSLDGVLFNHDRTALVQYPAAKTGSYNIPASVTTIGEAAFGGCSQLTGVTIPTGVASIPNWAFDSCTSLTGIAIPDSVGGIGYNAFRSCWNLTSVTIGNRVTDIAAGAFVDCWLLQGAYFTGNAPSVGDFVFEGANIVTVYYRPGTTGWGPTFGDRPTAPWLLSTPLILERSAGVQTNTFGFIISWATNAAVVVEATSSLAEPSWSPVSTNTLSDGWSYFSDPEWTNYSSRFYRLGSP
jgi:hypothetical protein